MAAARPRLEPGPLRAGGTLHVPPLTRARRIWLWIELAILYVLAPIAMLEAVHGHRVPLFVALVPVLAVVTVILLIDRSFALKRELSTGFSWRTAISIFVLLAAGTVASAAWLMEYQPRWLLEFPTNRPDVWTRVMLIYPLASVAAQEIVYRTFYFHRYGPLFGDWRGPAVILNGVLFGFGHIVIGSPFAMLATTLTGLLFAARYAETRSYWAVFIEHTLWGWMAFTVGLGRYFFTGVANI